mgnify:CR=1 FL=1
MSGDQVEVILDNKTSISPLWIRFVKKEKVKEKIKHFFRSKRRREFEILGKDILNYIAKSKNIVADALSRLNKFDNLNNTSSDNNNN